MEPQHRTPSDLQAALASGQLWRGRDGEAMRTVCVPTGFKALDRALPGGGWPLGTLVEVAPAPLPHVGVELFLPALAARMAEGHRAVWVAPPWQLHAPGLLEWGVDPERIRVVQTRDADPQTLWVMERFLRCPSCAMVLGWVRNAPSAALRRLQLAATRGGGIGVLFRAQGHDRPSPAPVRLRVRPQGAGLLVEFTRLRGALGRRQIQVE